MTTAVQEIKDLNQTMLNIIAIADDDALVGHIDPDADIDFLLSLGDLYDVTLENS